MLSGSNSPNNVPTIAKPRFTTPQHSVASLTRALCLHSAPHAWGYGGRMQAVWAAAERQAASAPGNLAPRTKPRLRHMNSALHALPGCAGGAGGRGAPGSQRGRQRAPGAAQRGACKAGSAGAGAAAPGARAPRAPEGQTRRGTGARGCGGRGSRGQVTRGWRGSGASREAEAGRGRRRWRGRWCCPGRAGGRLWQ